MGIAAVWFSCFLLRAADNSASAGTGRSAVAASWAGGTIDHRTCRCRGCCGQGGCGWSVHGLHKPVAGFLGWELVLPAGRCLGTLRMEDLQVVEGWWSGLEDELKTHIGVKVKFNISISISINIYLQQ